MKRLRIDLQDGVPVFALSKPGYDVDTASPANLLFDIASAGFSGVFMSGNVPFVAGSPWVFGSAGNFFGFTNYWAYTIPFGRTFSVAPKTTLGINDPTLGPGFFGPRYNFDSVQNGNSGGQVNVGAQSFVDKLVLYVQIIQYSGTVLGPSSISFVVYQG